ncbi:hypothetical protein BH10PSE14_BH10PSE14_20470 [soil metagenome]
MRLRLHACHLDVQLLWFGLRLSAARFDWAAGLADHQ